MWRNRVTNWIDVKEQMPTGPGRYLVNIHIPSEENSFFVSDERKYVDDADWIYEKELERNEYEREIYKKIWRFDHPNAEYIISWAEWPPPPEVKRD